MTMPAQSGTTASESPITGAALQPQYAIRVMRVYAINETEINQLSSLNGLATIFFSLGSFFASAAIGIYFNAIFYTDLTPAGTVAKSYVVPALIFVAVVSYAVAFYNVYQRSTVWGTIKKESGAP